MREAGELGKDQAVQTGRGERAFAAGDRVMFLRNERSMGVKNGSLGQVEAVTPASVAVRLDDGRRVAFDVKDYADVDHGYAATIHKAQGVTVDRAHVLASSGLDRHAAYVALTRHRDGVALHYGADQFRDSRELAKTLGRERAKDATLDYPAAFAERRGISVPESLQRPAPRERATEAERAPKRSRFAGLKLESPAKETADGRVGQALTGPERSAGPAATPEAQRQADELRRSVQGYTRAWADAERMVEQRLPVLPHQEAALTKAREGLEEHSKEAAANLRSALRRAPGLAAKGEGVVMAAMSKEAEIRRSPELRAERFVEDWSKLQARRGQLAGWEHADARGSVEMRMKSMAEGLGRDPQVESILRGKRQELGLGRSQAAARAVGDDLTKLVTRGRSQGLER